MFQISTKNKLPPPPDRVEPSFQPQPTRFENRSRSDAIFKPAGLTSTNPSGQRPKRGPVAFLANEPFRPPNFLKKTQTCVVVREYSIKFAEIFRVFQSPETLYQAIGPIKCICRKRYFPNSTHETFSSRELVRKKKELLFLNQEKKLFDPLFPLNQRCAMLRHDIKRLARRSWCTTKRPDRLETVLRIYLASQAAR